jgi:Na+/melibiose symporter-like transporter
VLSVVLFLIAFAVSKERVEPDARQEISVRRDLGDLIHNGPWIALFFVTFFYFTALLIRGNIMLPYFENCAGNRMYFSWFNGFGLIALLAGVACSTALTKRMGRRSVFLWSMSLTGILAIALFFLPPTAIVPIIGLEIVRQFAFGCSNPVLWAMMADVADYGEWKTGRRATGTVISAVVFALWIGVAMGGAIDGWLLSFFGYQSSGMQTEHALFGIRLIASVVSGAFFLVVALCLLFYRIDKKLNLKISNELAERRKTFTP